MFHNMSELREEKLRIIDTDNNHVNLATTGWTPDYEELKTIVSQRIDMSKLRNNYRHKTIGVVFYDEDNNLEELKLEQWVYNEAGLD